MIQTVSSALKKAYLESLSVKLAIKASRFVDKGAGDGAEIAVFLVKHAERMNEIGGAKIKKDQLITARCGTDAGFIEKAEAEVSHGQPKRRRGVGAVGIS